MLTEEDEAELETETFAIEAVRMATHESEPVPADILPPVLRRIFGTEAEDELMAVARLLDPAGGRKGLTLVFHTPIGDVRTPVNWCSHPADSIATANSLLLMIVRSSTSTFSPNPGAELEMSFAEYSGNPRLKVTCLASPMRLYPGASIDLLCFLPDTSGVEKNGRLKEGAPSAVSGLPSTEVDDHGEPVVEGEKSASVTLSPTEDFDVPREG